MNYLISRFACKMISEDDHAIYPNCRYLFDIEDLNRYIICDMDSGCFCKPLNYEIFHIDYSGNRYYIMSKLEKQLFMTTIKYKNSTLNINISDRLYITSDGELILTQCVDGLQYSHFEMRQNYLFVYFKGVRDYVVIIKNKEVKIASYYDEINILENEIVFLCKCCDCISHGKVFGINKDGVYEDYLVYISDRQIKDDSFIGLAFMDAIIVGNYKFANNLMSDSMRLDDAGQLTDFFCECDDYIVLEKNVYATINKNTLAGIYELIITDGKIDNIIHLS